MKKIPDVQFESEESRNSKLLVAALWGDDALAAVSKLATDYDMEMIKRLLGHFKIDPSLDFYSQIFRLCIAMGREHYPTPLKRGIKTKWTHMALGCLSVEIERLRPKQTIQGAARVLTTREPWKSFLSEGGDDAVEALRQAYYVAKKNPDTIRAKEMFRGYEASGNLAGWESYVDDYVKQN